MCPSWSPDLLVSVDRHARQPLRAQLEHQFRDAIRTGKLQPGERVPSSRELAAGLGLSRGLIQECYAQLQAEGYLISRPGSATRVASRATGTANQPDVVPPAPPGLIADFRCGVPDLRSFPARDWMWAVREATRTIAFGDLDYGDPCGHPGLREVLAGYLRRVRAATADPRALVVCSGYAQGLYLVLRTLRDHGIETVAYEDPGSPDMTAAAARHAGLDAVAVPVDEHGIDVAALDASQARAVVVTPAHQWPTGVVLGPARRRELIEWARRRDGYVIEDDYDAEFRYDKDPVGALQGLAPDRVLALGTVSKSLAPALRIGWVLGPPSLTASIARHKRLTDRGSPTLDQLALAHLIDSGRFDRHLRRMRLTYASRRATLVGTLTRHAPDVTITGLAAGFHAVIQLPSPVGEQAIVETARSRRIGIYGMSTWRANHATTPPQLVLGFGNTTDTAIIDGISTLHDLLSQRSL
jgi:GntR family transcriptional regulator / MocR family aminotransferase